MRLRFNDRTGTWLALLASVVFVGWPGLLRGNCCCEPDELIDVVTAPADAIDCCETEACDSTTDPPDGVKPCCGNTTDGLIDGDGDTQEHRCRVSCCQRLTAIAVKSVPPNQINSVDFLMAEARIEFPSGLVIRSQDLPDLPPRFLPAQDHCAQICSWLK